MERYGSGFKKKKERKGGREKERHVWVEFKKTFGLQVESFFQWDEMRSRKVYGEKDSMVVVSISLLLYNYWFHERGC